MKTNYACLMFLCLSVSAIALFKCCSNNESPGPWQKVPIRHRIESIVSHGFGSNGIIYLELENDTIIKMKEPYNENELKVAFKQENETVTFRSNRKFPCGYEFR